MREFRGVIRVLLVALIAIPVIMVIGRAAWREALGITALEARVEQLEQKP